MIDLDRGARAELFQRLAEIVERCVEPSERSLVARDEAPERAPRDARALLEHLAARLSDGAVPVFDRRYFGPFQPAPSATSVVVEALVSAFSPQLATRGHAPWPIAVEEELVADFGERFGWPRGEAGGALTSGGAEANTTSVIAALVASFPDVTRRGVRALPADPTLYVSSEGHGTVARAARIVGLGDEAVRRIPADAHGRMKPRALREAIARDRASGARPFLVVATLGTTSAGAIDPIPEIARVAQQHDLWLHVDAAWGGLAAFVPELRSAIDGCERADSITFDPHKAFAVPLGVGAILTRREGVLARVFREDAGYMPRDGSRDPYARSMQWSRRFAGLSVYATLGLEGFEGCAATLRHKIALAERLRDRLRERGFRIVNRTPLPVVCFTHSDVRSLDAVARHVVGEGAGWISVTRFANGGRALRACVNNHRTTAEDVDRLVDAVDRARAVLS